MILQKFHLENKAYAPDPCSNTGLNCQSVSPDTKPQPPTGKQGRLDWLQGTFKYSDNKTLEEIINDISIRVNQQPVITPGKPIGFKENSARFECGAVVGWTEPVRDEKSGAILWDGSIFVSFPARALTRLYQIGGHENTYMMFQLLDSVYGFKATRTDAACDDYDKSLNVSALFDALKAGNYSGFVNKLIHWDLGKAWTFVLGSRQSDELVRLYNKEEESKGSVKSFRMEREFHDDKANQVFEQLMNIPWMEWDTTGSKFLINVAIGKTKFIDRTGNPDVKYLRDIPVFDWWKQWTENIVPTGYSIPKVVHSLNKKMSNVKRNFMRSFVMIEKALGIAEARKWLNKQLDWARENLTTEQENYANEWRKDIEASRVSISVESDKWDFASIPTGGNEVELPSQMQDSWGRAIQEAVEEEIAEVYEALVNPKGLTEWELLINKHLGIDGATT